MRKKIVIIGASYLQLPLVKKARELNLETHVFAWESGSVAKNFADHFYSISIIEKEKILAVCKEIKPQAIVSIASDLATVTVNYIAKELKLIGNSILCTQYSRNKYLMRTAFLANGIKTPKFVKINCDRIYDIEGFKFPLIVKPTDSSGSRGVNKLNSQNQIDDAFVEASKYSTTKEAIIEEYIEGDEISVETISFCGKHYLITATDKVTTGAPHFVETAHHQPSKYLEKIEDRIKNLTFQGLDALQIKNGAAHTEIKITPKMELFIVEIGARMGGDLIGSNLVELSTGYDFLKGVIEVSLGEFNTPKKTRNDYSGIFFITPKRTGVVKGIIDRTGGYPFIIEKDIDVKIGDEAKLLANSLERKGYYIYKNSSKFLEDDLIELIIE